MHRGSSFPDEWTETDAFGRYLEDEKGYWSDRPVERHFVELACLRLFELWGNFGINVDRLRRGLHAGEKLVLSFNGKIGRLNHDGLIEKRDNCWYPVEPVNRFWPKIRCMAAEGLDRARELAGQRQAKQERPR